MEFALSEDQRALQDAVRSFLATSVPLDVVRRAAAGDTAVRADVQSGLAELGASQILVPVEFGGLGLSVLDAALVQEMLGYFAAPAAFTAGAAMAVVTMDRAGSAAQQARWLPQIASGEARFGVAMGERSGARDGAGVQVAADGTLRGKSLFALEVEGATHLLLAGSAGDVFVVATDADGLAVEPMPTIDRTRDVSAVTFDGVVAERLELGGENALDRAMQVGRVLLAADALGAAQQMLEQSVVYAHERKQFNRAIGSFQAVKHMCAEMAAEIEPSRALVWHAAYALDADPVEGPLLAHLAKAHLAEIGTSVARTATEVHGGMGFTDLLGLHFWFKRIGLDRQLLGGPERVRAEAARLQGWA